MGAPHLGVESVPVLGLGRALEGQAAVHRDHGAAFPPGRAFERKQGAEGMSDQERTSHMDGVYNR
ncbi:hypothetical protein GCM10020220_006770 [Nonomuraea rubra]